MQVDPSVGVTHPRIRPRFIDVGEKRVVLFLESLVHLPDLVHPFPFISIAVSPEEGFSELGESRLHIAVVSLAQLLVGVPHGMENSIQLVLPPLLAVIVLSCSCSV